MNREIKFRAWHKTEKRMDLVTFWDFVAGGLIFTGEETLSDEAFEAQEDTPIRRALTDECEIMQFTGLLDKDGRDIYEGDILTDCYKRLLQVVWWNHGFQFKALKETNFAYAAIGQWFDGYTEAPEVIGNIYENPELFG